MGKNISIYLDDKLLNMVASSGKKPSEIIQDALKRYFMTDQRKQAFEQFAKASQDLGQSQDLKKVIEDWKTDRENDRW